jgi:hypothetical protein
MLRATSYGLVPILALVFLTHAQRAPAAGSPETEATSTIRVVKTAGPAPGVEEYRVKEGEHLWQILRKRLGRGTERQIARLYRQTLRLNPGLDPQLIEPGQVLRLPAARPPAAAKAAVAAKKPPRRAGAKGSVKAPEVTREVFDAAALRERAARAGDGLTALYAELGEETVCEGKHFIPLPETGQVVLDASKFPLLQVRGSTRFVLDLESRIPAEVDELLADAGGYRVLRFDARRGVRGLLDDALTGSGLKVERGGSLRLRGPREADAEVHSDWLVTRSDEREVICLISKPEEATSTAVARHLARRGVHVIDVLEPKQGAIQVMRREALALPKYSPPEVAEGTGELISRILTLLGQGYERNPAVSLFGSRDNPLSGFSLKYSADFGFEREGKKYLVDLAGLSPRWRKILEKKGYQVLAIPGGTRGEEAAAILLRFLGQDFAEGYTLLGSSRPESNNIRLKVPGLLLDYGQKKFFLSGAETDEGLACALDQAGLRLIQIR